MAVIANQNEGTHQKGIDFRYAPLCMLARSSTLVRWWQTADGCTMIGAMTCVLVHWLDCWMFAVYVRVIDPCQLEYASNVSTNCSNETEPQIMRERERERKNEGEKENVGQ